MKKYLFIIFLTISVLAKAQYYSILAIPYNPAPYLGTSVSVGGDSFSPVIPLGFNFCFYGNIYDSVAIGSNGIVSFLTPSWINECNNEIYDVTLPTLWSAQSPKNCIMLPWQDLDPSLGGSILYSSYGLAPNRVFVVSFDNVPMDSCSKVFKGQVELFETNNIIETHIASKDTCLHWNQGRAVHGLHGPVIAPSTTYGDFVSGRNYPNCVWTATNEGTKFTPLVDVCSSLSINNVVTPNNNILIYPNPATSSISVHIPQQFGDAVKIELYNSIGQLKGTMEMQASIDISSYENGLYFLIATNVNGEKLIARVIKE